MKECIHKAGVSCFDEADVFKYIWGKGYPDNFISSNAFIENIRARKKDGCEVCHFYKAGFKGSVETEAVCLMALAC